MEKFIWLQDDKDENIITRGIIVIKDKNGYLRILEELKDINTYVFAGCHLYPGSSSNYTEYTCGDATIFENFGETEMYNRSHHESRYTNPRRWVNELMTYDFDSEKNLLDLFSTIQKGNSRERQIEEYKKAQMLLSQLSTSSLSNETIKTILKGMWPNFGYFATECLNFTDIKTVKEYDITEIRHIIESSQKMGIEISREMRDILFNEQLAKSNGKVLSLARKANRLSN